MTGEDELRALWRDQPTKEVPAMTIEMLKERSDRLARKARVRNWSETIAGVTSAAFCAWLGVRAAEAPLLRLSCALLVLGEGVVLLSLWRRGRPRPEPEVSASTGDYLGHYRGELARERDLLARVGWWYLAPMAPGLVLFSVAVWGELFGRRGFVANAVVTVASLAVVSGIIVALNRRASRRLARELSALEAG